ncbi:polysaccharide biosynthesis protein [Metallumcola ferriviriculae]|uniref:Polysaccharide biosynthesis protein n=1 Tax=Metallumcola ferriviriculae TaxID=3039180 RepID=A0AAU0UJR0_9FIRM|nr:polysaccharide biosynthesis protein [Desulfitibacteraceae bacterium MK1]
MTGRDGFIRGAAILALAGFISKSIGAFYRIPFARLVGGEGVGLYQMVYPIYTVVLALSTAGIPVAISVLVAEKTAQGDYYGANRIFKVALILLSVASLLFAAALMMGADFLATEVLKEPRAQLAIKAIAPAIFITGVMSSLRGFFQGQQVMHPTAISQVLEQSIRVITVFIAVFVYSGNITLIAAGATFGAVTGSAVGLAFLIWYFLRKRNTDFKRIGFLPQERKRVLVKRIIVIALPLSLGNLIMPIMQLIDAVVVPQRLRAAGYAVNRATELFGQFTGMAGTLINLPTIITLSLAVSLVPAIAEASSRGYLEQAAHRGNAALRVTTVLLLPAAAGLWALAEPISIFLFSISEVGVPLRYLAGGVVFLGLYQVTAGVLQGMSKTYIPVINLFIGAAVKLLLSYWLTAIPTVGIRGAAMSTVLGFFTAFMLNYLSLKIFLPGMAIKRYLFKPMLAVTIMTGIVVFSYGRFLLLWGNAIAVMGVIIIAVFAYLIMLAGTGALRLKDVEALPFAGSRIIKILVRLGFVR